MPGEEAPDEPGAVLHVPEPGLGQRGELGDVAPGQVGQGSLQVGPGRTAEVLEGPLREHPGEIPAAILARALGIHVQSAIQWQKIFPGDWAAYAADISSRSWPQPLPSRHETQDRA